MSSDPPPQSSHRLYRSRKQRPCDACRRRKICCVREASSPACSLCTLRSTTCTYHSQPNIRRRRADRRENGTPETTSRLASPESAEEWTPLFVGFSSDQDPYILRHCQFKGDSFDRPDWRCRRMALSSETGKVTEIPMHFAVVPDSHLDTTEQGLPRCPQLNLPIDLYDGLMRTFFNVVHTSLPLLDGGRFEKKTDNNSPLVAIMCRLARHFSPGLRSGSLVDASWPDWRAYLHQAVAINARSPRLETLEMGLLFIQRPLSTHRAPNLPGLWPLIGSLVGMAHDLGLNVDPTGWAIEESERKRRIRIWWALYIADKWNALGSGRPSYIHEDNWDVPMVSMGDMPIGYDGASPPEATGRMFIAMAHLTTILSDVLGRLYSIRAIRNYDQDADGVFRECDSFMTRLEKFEQDHVIALEWPEKHVRKPTGESPVCLWLESS
ncbi:fungal-specific transcription factor domain-containing protein [Aspergillus filifer]